MQDNDPVRTRLNALEFADHSNRLERAPYSYAEHDRWVMQAAQGVISMEEAAAALRVSYMALAESAETEMAHHAA